MTDRHGQAKRRPQSAHAFAACALLLLPLSGSALSWEYIPQLSVGVEYETNPGYAGESEDDGYSPRIGAGVTFNGQSQRSSLSFAPRINRSWVTGTENDDDLDTLDYFLPFSGSWSEDRAAYGFDAGYSYITTNDYDVTNPNDPLPGGQYGRIVVNDDQEQYYLAPYASFQITPRDILGVSLSTGSYEYDDAPFTGRSDYDSASGRVTWTRALTLQSKISVGANLSWFDSSRPSRLLIPSELPFVFPSLICVDDQNQFILCAVKNETWSYGGDVGYQYSLTPTSAIGITAGVAHSEIEVSGTSGVDADEDPGTPDLPCYDPDEQIFITCTLKTSDETFIGRVFYDQRAGDTITMGFSIARSIQPSSDGAQVVSDFINAYMSKQFSTRLTGTLGAGFTRQEAVGADSAERAAARFDNEYARIDANLTWQLSGTWSLRTGYSFSRDDERSGSAAGVDNHTIGVFAEYTGLGRP
jgi:hypothetical protein